VLIDEVSVYSQLASPLFGALVHTVGVLGPVFDARIAAGRIFNATGNGASSYVTAQQIQMPTGALNAIQDWPLQQDSLFGYFEQKQWTNKTARPRQEIDEFAYAQLRLYRPIEVFTPITDAVCLSVPIEGHMWAMISLLRCAEQKPFTDPHVTALERFKPAIANVFRHGLSGWPNHAGSESNGSSANGDSGERRSTSQILSRLTPTERRVLHYLQSGITEREIANQMHRSPHTIHVHVKNIYRKLDVSSRRELLDVFGSSGDIAGPSS